MTKKAIIDVLDISEGGMKFISNLNLPVTPLVILQSEIQLLNHNCILKGNIIRKKQLLSHRYEYGFQFVEEEKYLGYIVKKLSLKFVGGRRHEVSTRYYIDS